MFAGKVSRSSGITSVLVIAITWVVGAPLPTKAEDTLVQTTSAKDTTDRYLFELSTHTIKFGKEFGNNDLYLAFRPSSTLGISEFLVVPTNDSSTVLNSDGQSHAFTETFLLGVGMDHYWHPYDFDVGLRSEVDYTSYFHSFDFQTNEFSFNGLAEFIVVKRFNRFSVGASTGPIMTWLYDKSTFYESDYNEIITSNNMTISLTAEVFARLYW